MAEAKEEILIVLLTVYTRDKSVSPLILAQVSVQDVNSDWEIWIVRDMLLSLIQSGDWHIQTPSLISRVNNGFTELRRGQGTELIYPHDVRGHNGQYSSVSC